ncbi:MAG: transglutaminase family protein [Bradyrhizobium sp.]|nr:MAG: transglutaminase family protein [Bradyrhizobium sp.]
MRIAIAHTTTFAFAPPARALVQNLRLTPRSFDSQYVLRWRLEMDVDGALRRDEDSLGNIVHAFSHPAAIERFSVSAVGEVETSDAVGVIRGEVEPLPSAMFLRASALAQTNGALREFALEAVGDASDRLERLHRLMDAVHQTMAYEPGESDSYVGSGEAFALRRGGVAEFAHIYIACARFLEIPARFVSGYFVDEGSPGHGLFAWAEAEAPGLGWVAFDPVNNQCADARYVRVAIGLDGPGATPFRTAHSAGGGAKVDSTVRIRQASGQAQN